MLRQILAISLSYVVLFTSSGNALAASPEELTRKITEKVSAIPDGSVVEVKTNDKQLFKGRIGSITVAGFAVQTVRNEKVETLAVEYKNVKSVKVLALKDEPRKRGRSTAGWVVIGGLAALGTILVVGIVLVSDRRY